MQSSISLENTSQISSSYQTTFDELPYQLNYQFSNQDLRDKMNSNQLSDKKTQIYRPKEKHLYFENDETDSLKDKLVSKNYLLHYAIEFQGSSCNKFWKSLRKSNESLWDAAERGLYEVCQELLDIKKQLYPAEVNSRALDNWTALHMAANSGHFQVAEVLLNYGADLEAKTKMSRTPLHLSCIRGHLDIAKLLINSGADINSTDNEFNTPLHYASEYGHLEIVSFLLDKNPDMSLKNYADMTPFDVATSVKTRKMFEDLQLMSQNDLNSFGRTCFDDSIHYNSRADIIGKLLFLKSYNNRMIKNQNPKNIIDRKNQTYESRNDDVANIIIEDVSTKKIKFDKKEEIGPFSFLKLELLGKGSFGEVYLVQKKSNNKLYAMKLLKKDKILTQSLTQYATAERNVLVRMNHPFIVKLNYAFQTETYFYLILDYCPKGNLASLISRKKQLDEDLAKIYAAEVTLALEALHKKDIVYRDLKSENVVLDEDGHALLTDFGLSKEGVKEQILTSFCGSVAYLAPEILQKNGHNKSVDWYLLGALIYEMLVGVPPYFAREKQKLFENIKNGELHVPQSLSNQAKDLIISLLKRDPKERLGAKKSSEEIKKHPWFSGINWEDVLLRRLSPPQLELMQSQHKETAQPIFDQIKEKDERKNYIQGWSFIKSDRN